MRVGARTDLRRELRRDRLESSFLGYLGRGLEPVTRFADFDWKINVALLTSFAARENSVATLGVLFDQDDGQNLSLEERMGCGYGVCNSCVVDVYLPDGSVGHKKICVDGPILDANEVKWD